ncbi:hypothetical protein RA265_29210, partial [Pseudomonas syringae pv. tagetis]|uniref:hypothetical protein n=1 Tax=Pseudomonas syringae group genomosp. 7 TaxID=251699 RepID=UPI00376F73E5
MQTVLCMSKHVAPNDKPTARRRADEKHLPNIRLGNARQTYGTTPSADKVPQPFRPPGTLNQ